MSSDDFQPDSGPVCGWMRAHPLAAIFLLALAVRLAGLAFHPEAWQEKLIKDALLYHTMALNVISGEGLRSGGELAVVPPLYPLFLAGVYKLFGVSRIAVLVIQALLGSVLVLYVHRFACYLFGSRAGWAAGLAAVFYWPLATTGFRPASEVLFMPLFAAGVFHLVQAMDSRARGEIALGALLLGLASLTRSVPLYLPAAGAAWLLWRAIREKHAGPLADIAVLLAVFGLTLLPWAARNYQRLGVPVVSSTNTGMVLATGNMPREGKIFGFNFRRHNLPPGDRHILDLPELEKNEALKQLALRRLKENPGQIPKLLLLKTMYFFSPFDWELLGREEGAFNPWFVWVLLFAVFGMASVEWDFSRCAAGCVILYIFALSMVAYASPRLRLPAVVFIIVFASAGWLRAEYSLGRGKKSLALIALMVISSVAAYYWSAPLKQAALTAMEGLGLW